MEEENRCYICFRDIEIGQGFDFSKCKHSAHYECVDEEIDNFALCADCDPAAPNETKNKLPIKEISQYEGHDYITQPVIMPYQDSLDVAFQGKPSMEKIIIGNELHMQRLLWAGMTIDDFLRFGYTWEDLQKFADLAKPGERRVATLFALGCTADHFRFYPDRLPAKKMGVTPKDLRESFGLGFAEKDGPLTVFNIPPHPDHPWRLSDLAALGFKAEDVFAAGLYRYKQLLSLDPTEQEMAEMKFKQRDIDELSPRQRPADVYRREEKKEGLIIFNDTGVTVKKQYCGLKKRK